MKNTAKLQNPQDSNVLQFDLTKGDMTEAEMYEFVDDAIAAFDYEPAKIAETMRFFRSLNALGRSGIGPLEDRLIFMEKRAFAETAEFSEAFEAFSARTR